MFVIAISMLGEYMNKPLLIFLLIHSLKFARMEIGNNHQLKELAMEIDFMLMVIVL
jgi:hypothetical protein